VANENIGQLTFVSALQRGMAAGLDKEDVFPRTEGQARAESKLVLGFTGAQTANVTLTLVGPGEVIGLDTRTIVRVYPRRDDNDAEFEHFAMVEFDQADILWRYTAAKAHGDAAAKEDKLRPWLTLVVGSAVAAGGRSAPPPPRRAGRSSPAPDAMCRHRG